MIRILEAFGEPISTGGQESYVFNTVGAMNRSGMSFDLFTPYYKDSPIADSLAKEWGGSVYSLGLEFRPGRSRENLSRAFSSFLESHRYDIVHIHSGSTSALAILARAAKRSGASVIVHAHAAVERMNFRKRAIRELNGLRMAGSVDAYCACSRSVADTRFRRGVRSRVRIMRNGIDTARFAFDDSNRVSARSEGGVSDGGVVVGNVGRLSEVKNQAFLIRVFSEYRKKTPDAKLWIVGDGPERASLESEIGQLGLSDDVTIWGRRGDVPRLLSGMDVFILPSLSEGFPYAAIEAQASGCPVIISDRVTLEASLCPGFVEQASLEAPASDWLSAIGSLASKGRNRSGAKQVEDAGYELVGTAKSLRHLYLELSRQYNKH